MLTDDAVLHEIEQWLLVTVDQFTRADPRAMTTYILGLLQKQLPKYELMDLCTAQLSGILDDSVNFVAILFDKLEQFGAFHDTPVGQHGFLHNVNMYTNTQGHAVQETLDSSVLEIHHTANVADRCAPISYVNQFEQPVSSHGRSSPLLESCNTAVRYPTNCRSRSNSRSPSNDRDSNTHAAQFRHSKPRSDRSNSRSRSPRNKFYSTSRNRSRNRSRSRSRSRSISRNRSRSRHQSRSRSRSINQSRSRSGSRNHGRLPRDTFRREDRRSPATSRIDKSSTRHDRFSHTRNGDYSRSMERGGQTTTTVGQDERSKRVFERDKRRDCRIDRYTDSSQGSYFKQVQPRWRSEIPDSDQQRQTFSFPGTAHHTVTSKYDKGVHTSDVERHGNAPHNQFAEQLSIESEGISMPSLHSEGVVCVRNGPQGMVREVTSGSGTITSDLQHSLPSKDIPYQIQPPSEQVSLPIPYAWQASNSCISTPAPILTQPQMYTPPIPEPEYRREFTVPPSNCSTSGFQLDVHLPQSAGVPHSTQHNSSTQDQPPQNGSLEWESPTRAFVTPETTPFIIPSPAAPTTVYSSSKTISSSQLQNRNPMQNATQPQGYKRWPPKDHREWKSATKTGALKVVGIPKHLNRIELLNEHFSKFGTILNLQVKPQSNRAFVQFSTHEEAMAAIQSPDAVCGNRFIQVFWANFGHVDQHASADDAKRKTVPPTVQIPVQPTPNKGQIHSYKPGQLNNNVPNMKGENQIPAIDKPTAPNNPSAQPPPSTVLAPKQAPSVQLSTLSNKLAEYKKMVEAVEKKKDLLDPSEQAQLMQSLAAVHKSLLSALAAKQASPFAKSGGITPSTLADTTQHGQKRPPRVTYSAIPPITAADRPKYCPQPKRPRNTGIAPPQSANAKMCNSIEVSYSELKQQVDALKQQALKLGLDPLALKPISHISRLPSTEPPLSQFPAHSAAVKFYNLPLHLQTESALKPILQQFGPIRDIRIETDTTGISSTVNFETQAAADRALHLGIPGESVKVSPGEPSTDTPAHGSHAPPPIQDQQDDVSTTTNAEGYTVQVYQSGTSENQFYGGNEYQDTDSPERSWKHS